MSNILNLLIFAISCSLITMAFGYFSEKRNRAEIIIVFAVCFFAGVDTLFLLSEETSFYKYYPHLLYINQPFEFFLGPLVYYRFRIMVEGKIKFDRLTVFLLLPGVLAVLYFIPFFMQSPEAKLASVGFTNVRNGAVRGIYHLILYSAAPWFMFCVALFIVHGRRILSAKGIRLILHKKVLMAYNLVWIAVFIALYIATLLKQSLMLRGVLLLINSMLIVFFYLEKKHADFFLAMRRDSSETRYKRSMLGGVDTAAVMERIHELMELENIYFDEDLSLRSLSARLGITPHQLSEILNSRLHANFRYFINSYRIGAAKKLLLENENISVIRAAYQCGFNSKNAFNTAFSKIEGMTPTEFKERNKKRVLIYKTGRQPKNEMN